MPSQVLYLDGRHLPVAANAGLFVSRGQGIHPDRMIDSYELIFVRSGTIMMEEAGQTLQAQESQTLLLWPGRRHRGVQPYGADLSFYWIHFHLRTTARAPELRIPQLSQPRRPDRLMELYHRFLDDQQDGRLSPIAANSLMTLMLCEVADNAPSDDALSAARLLAGRAEAYIAAHAQKPNSATTIADHLQCNPDYLGRVYRRIFGHTLTDAIHRQRCRDARKLLLESTLNVDQIARQVGFESAGYLRRLFKRSEGITPLRYRQLHRRIHINWR